MFFTQSYLEGKIIWEQKITVLNTGEIRFENKLTYDQSLPSLARVGLKFSLVPGFENLQYLGRGPHENYCDRKSGAALGLYDSTVNEQYVPYILPQAHGNHCDVKYFSLSDSEDSIHFRADEDFQFSVSHYTQEDLFSAFHTYELKKLKCRETWVQIDHLQRGLGTGSCGPSTREAYCITPGEYSFTFTMKIN